MIDIWIDGDELSDACGHVYDALVKAGKITKSVDFIGESEDFDVFYERIRSMFPVTRNEAMCCLMNLRKSGDKRCSAPDGRKRKQNL